MELADRRPVPFANNLPQLLNVKVVTVAVGLLVRVELLGQAYEQESKLFTSFWRSFLCLFSVLIPDGFYLVEPIIPIRRFALGAGRGRILCSRNVNKRNNIKKE